MALKVNEQTDIVKAMAEAWCLTTDLMGGTSAMRKAGELYLPRWPDEDQKDYRDRLSASTLFPAFGETVEALAAKPFSKPITVGDDVPPKIVELLPNIDMEGRNLHNFAHDVMLQVMGPGLAGILVDVPVRGEGVRTQADEAKAGIRPYWVQVKAGQILGWVAERVSGEWQLTQLRIMECIEEKDGEFGTRSVEQVRVLARGAWATYRKVENASDWVVHESGTTTLDAIPFAPAYGKRTGFMTSKPPLLEVAHLNVKHWQSQSDQDNILRMARVPILAMIGVDSRVDKSGNPLPVKLSIGANSINTLPNGADLKFVEHTGAAIEAGQKSIDALENQMRQAGAEFLVLEQRVEKSATQTASEDSVSMCKLQRIANGLEDAIALALQFTADFLKAGDGGTVKLFSDYGAQNAAEASLQILLNAASAGKISDETFRAELKRRGTLSPDVDEEEERQRLEEQGPALGAMNDTAGGNANSQ